MLKSSSGEASEDTDVGSARAESSSEASDGAKIACTPGGRCPSCCSSVCGVLSLSGDTERRI